MKILKDLGKIHKGPLKIFSKNIEDPVKDLGKIIVGVIALRHLPTLLNVDVDEDPQRILKDL